MYAVHMVKSIVEIDNQTQKYILYYIQKMLRMKYLETSSSLYVIHTREVTFARKTVFDKFNTFQLGLHLNATGAMWITEVYRQNYNC
jgi:uncharacterized protein YegJ (DUF2314 family)